jgi:hypothetical protein
MKLCTTFRKDGFPARAEAVYRVAIDDNGALDAGKTAGLRETR